MKQKSEELASLQIDLRDSEEYNTAIDMFINLVEALNHLGRHYEALAYQNIVVNLIDARRQVLTIPNPGVSYAGAGYTYKTE